MMNNKLLTMTLCLALLQVGCGESDNQASVTASSTPEATALAVESVNRVSAKPGLPVALATPRQGMDVGVATRVDLALTTQLSTGRFEARMTPSAGLVVVAGELAQQLTLKGAGTLPMSLEVRADAPGKYYVNIEVTNPTQVDGLNRRALAVVVIAGGEGIKAQSAEPKSDNDKHVLPAEETIH